MRFSRRTLLKAGLIGGGLSVAGLSATAWAWFRPRPAAPGYTVLSELEIGTVRALVDTYFAPGNALGVTADALDVTGAVDAHFAALAERPRLVLRAAYNLLDNWPRLSLQSTSRFQDLPRERRAAIMLDLDHSGRPELRALAEGVRVFVGMHLWELPVLKAAVGQVPGCAFGEEPA